MAKVELRSGTDPRLRRLAQEIIVTQQSENRPHAPCTEASVVFPTIIVATILIRFATALCSTIQ